MAPRAAWVAWAAWICNPDIARGRPRAVTDYCPERAGFGPLFFLALDPCAALDAIHVALDPIEHRLP